MLTFLFYVNRNSFSNKGFIIRQGIRYPTRVSLSDKCLNIILHICTRVSLLDKGFSSRKGFN